MNDFFDNWNSNPRYRAGVKLAVSSVLVLFVSIFVIVNARNQNLNNLNTLPQNNINEEAESKDSISISLPKDYTYKFSVSLNDENYMIEGSYENNINTFSKTKDDVVTNYVFQDEKYYKVENGINTEVLEKEIYGELSADYFSIEKINKYLEVASLTDEGYKVYLKDIIFDNKSDEYILLVKEENKISVDYTSLLNTFNNSISKFSIIFEYEGKE